MRDYLLTLLIFGSLPFILARPYIGVLVWSWLSYMNPHRLTWGFAYDFPFAQVVAITLFISLLFNKEPKRIPLNGLVVIWIVFIAWMLLSTVLAVYTDLAWAYYLRVLKIQAIVFLTMMIMVTKERINYLVWAIFLSIGFFGIKGGVFALMTGGAYRVYGPAQSMISENNALAVAELMILPLGIYLFNHQLRKKIYRYALAAGLVLILLAIVASQSRGALLAILAVASYMWLKSSKKLVTAIALIPLLAGIFMLMPATWHERMETISEYEQDASAMSRLRAWKYSINAANDNITGAGFNSWSMSTYELWAPGGNKAFVAHSIYFNVLADHGWPGLLMFLSIFYLAWRKAGQIYNAAKDEEDYRWAATLAQMLKISFVAYASGGAFLSLSYFDLPWHLVSIVVLVDQYLRREGVLQTEREKASALRASREGERLPAEMRRLR